MKETWFIAARYGRPNRYVHEHSWTDPVVMESRAGPNASSQGERE